MPWLVPARIERVAFPNPMATGVAAVRRENQQGGCRLLLSPHAANLAFTLGKVAGPAWKASMNGATAWAAGPALLLQPGYEWAHCSALRR